MSPQWKIKPFEALSLTELYQILQLRSEVFIVEQNCAYCDVDGKDTKALHVIGQFDGAVVAYARLFKPGDYFDKASIGRVVVSPLYRDRNWGHDLMRESISAIGNLFSTGEITISAQLYLKKFYEGHKFHIVGAPYLEDDIPHIRMEKKAD